jgi:MFS family permease
MRRTSTVLVCAAGALRAAAVSLVGILIAIHLASRGLTPAAIGLVIGCGIAGSAFATVVTGMWADRWGRRRTQLVVGVLSGAGYIGIAQVSGVLPLIGIAFLGLVNGMGRDRGPASALDQAMLPSLTTDEQRTWALAWYNAAVDGGHALGALAAAIPTVAVKLFAVDSATAHAATFTVCGLVLLLASLPYALLPVAVETTALAHGRTTASIDLPTRSVVRKIALLFGMDSVGAGFLNASLIAYWFFERYGTSEAQLAGLFFLARMLNVASHVAAAWIARRIGLLNTMVFTHLPSSVLLMLAPASPSAGVAAALFLAREALVEMDVPTRQSYVMAVVPPEARTYASGMTNVARNAGWVVGPLVAGSVMQHLALAAPLFIGGTLKIAYDLLLYRSFRHIRPPEEAPRLAVV